MFRSWSSVSSLWDGLGSRLGSRVEDLRRRAFCGRFIRHLPGGIPDGRKVGRLAGNANSLGATLADPKVCGPVYPVPTAKSTDRRGEPKRESSRTVGARITQVLYAPKI